MIVGSKDLNFDDYVQLRLIGFTLWMTNKVFFYSALIKFLRQREIDVSDLFFKMVERKDDAPQIIQDVYEKFKRATVDELFDSPEEILKKIKKKKEYEKLLNEEAGFNVIRYHHTMILSECMDEWTEYVLKIAHNLLEENNKLTNEVQAQFKEI